MSELLSCICPAQPEEDNADLVKPTAAAVEAPPSTEETFEVVAPPGKVGIIFYSSLSDYGHEVKSVKETSPLLGKVQAGDIIIAIDGDDTSKCDYNAIADALLAKKEAPMRALKILRPKLS